MRETNLSCPTTSPHVRGLYCPGNMVAPFLGSYLVPVSGFFQCCFLVAARTLTVLRPVSHPSSPAGLSAFGSTVAVSSGSEWLVVRERCLHRRHSILAHSGYVSSL